MTIPTNLFTYAQWSGIATIVCLIVAIVGFILGWSFRFRLVGVTSFMTVLTLSILALGLGLFHHAQVPGSARYALIYDNGANQAVIAVPSNVEASAVEPTLRQAAADLYSYGRSGVNGNNQFTVKLRTVLHPEPGVSQPLFLGEAKRSLVAQGDQDIQIEVFTRNLAQLTKLIS